MNDGLNSQYKFNGKEQDGETGYYYYGARYYNPRVSLWLNVDPLSGLQPYYNTEHYIDGQHNGGVYNLE
jgi:RHS repeat-associated protein